MAQVINGFEQAGFSGRVMAVNQIDTGAGFDLDIDKITEITNLEM